MAYEERDLKRWTEYFWALDGEPKWKYYLCQGDRNDPPKPLLEIEMEHTGAKDNLPKDFPPTTLALLVGTSFEPLFQTIWAYRPDRLVPVLNGFYGDRPPEYSDYKTGAEWWEEFSALLQYLPDEVRSKFQTPDITATVKDDPTAVFDYLNERLKDDLRQAGRRVVVDITGAKKTMVAGAYLFAAQTNTLISYVDFDRWDNKQGKPYGYSCRIGEVSNPLRDWAVEAWQRVRTHYNERNFTAALAALATIKLADEFKAAIDLLRQFLSVCAAWDIGDLRAAKEQMVNLPAKLKEAMPIAIEKLGGYWPDQRQPASVNEQFLLNPRDLLIYSCDELAKAQRLVGRKVRPDNRSAFARAYAVYETMIKARVLILFTNNMLSGSRKSRNSATPPRVLITDEIKTFVLGKMLTSGARNLLNLETGQRKLDQGRIIIEAVPNALSVDRPTEFTEEEEDELRSQRNLLTHTYVPVTTDQASRAIAYAQAYQREYAKNWGKEIDSTFTPPEELCKDAFDVPDWEKVKELCGLDFLLPENEEAQ